MYNSTSPFTIKLKVVSDIGCVSGEVNQTIQQSAKPIASFTSSAIRCINNDILFTDASSTPSGTIAKWIWDLADGAGLIMNTTNATVSTKYGTDGAKTVSLQVESATGCRSETYQPLFNINPQPLVKFGLPEVCLSDALLCLQIAVPFLMVHRHSLNGRGTLSGSRLLHPAPLANESLQNPQIKYAKAIIIKYPHGYFKRWLYRQHHSGFYRKRKYTKVAFAITNATPYWRQARVVTK